MLDEAIELAKSLESQSTDSFCLRQCYKYCSWNAEERSLRLSLRSRFQENLAWRDRGESPDSAANRFIQIAEGFIEIGDSAAAIKVWQHSGEILSTAARNERAEKLIRQSLSAAQAIGDRDAIGRSFNLLGSHFERIGSYLSAGEYFDSARVVRTKLDDQRGLAECLANISSIYLVFERRDDALRFAGEALRIRRELADTIGVLQIVLNLVPSFHEELSTETLHGLVQEAADLLRATRVTRFAGRMDLSRALQLARDGNADSATLVLERVAADPAMRTDLRFELMVLQHLAARYLAAAELPAAIQTYQRAQKLADSSGNRVAQATIAHNLGALQQRCGNLEEASGYYVQSLSLRQQLQLVGQALPTLINVTDLYITAKDFASAAQYLAAADAVAANAGELRALEQTALLHARFEAARGQRDRAAGWVDSARSLSAGVMSPQREFDLTCLRAELARRAGDLIGAESLIESAERLSAAPVSRANRQKLQLLQAMTAFDRHDWEGARERFTALVAQVERSRAALPDLEMRTDFQSQSRFAYERLVATFVELYRHRPQRALLDSILVYIEKAKSRSLLDALSTPAAQRPEIGASEQRLLAELDSLELLSLTDSLPTEQRRRISRIAETDAALRRLRFDRIGVANVAAYRPTPLAITRLQNRLDEQSMLITYLVAAERSFALHITGDTAFVEELTNRAQITELVAQFSRLVQLSIDDESLLDSLDITSSQLGTMLLPHPDRISNRTRRLLISPDAALNVVPFEALIFDDQYLTKRFAVCMLPSAFLLNNTGGQSMRSASRRLLAIADPRPRSPMSQLPYSEEEVFRVSEFFPPGRATILSGTAATLTSILQLDLKAYTHIHFATHSSIHYDDPLRCKIWLSGDTLTSESRDYLTLADVRALPLASDLVVLSSCESGGGSFDLGEGMNGFVRAFFEAGARNLIVSLWEVEDFASAGFMQSFYRNLDSGYEIALQTAKLEMIASPRRKHRHPYFWSPFVLTTANPAAN